MTQIYRETVWLNEVLITQTVLDYMLELKECEDKLEAHQAIGKDVPVTNWSIEYSGTLNRLRSDLEHNREMVGLLLTDQLLDKSIEVIAKEIQE